MKVRYIHRGEAGKAAGPWVYILTARACESTCLPIWVKDLGDLLVRSRAGREQEKESSLLSLSPRTGFAFPSGRRAHVCGEPFSKSLFLSILFLYGENKREERRANESRGERSRPLFSLSHPPRESLLTYGRAHLFAVPEYMVRGQGERERRPWPIFFMNIFR